MTRDEAFEAMFFGNKITHNNFCDDEFYYLVKDKIIAEDGVNHTEVFWSEDQGNWRKDGWSIKRPHQK